MEKLWNGQHTISINLFKTSSNLWDINPSILKIVLITYIGSINKRHDIIILLSLIRNGLCMRLLVFISQLSGMLRFPVKPMPKHSSVSLSAGLSSLCNKLKYRFMPRTFYYTVISYCYCIALYYNNIYSVKNNWPWDFSYLL